MENPLDNRADVFWALDAWFDSQDIKLTERAYLCAEASGIYQGQIGKSKKHFQEGVLILGKTLVRSACGVFIALREKTP